MRLAMPQLVLPKFSLPKIGGGGIATGLVIRASEVELLAMKGKSITNRVRVPLEGKDDQALVTAIQKALGAVAVKTKRLAVSISTHSGAGESSSQSNNCDSGDEIFPSATRWTPSRPASSSWPK